MASGLPVVLTPQSAEGIQAESGRHFEVASSVEEFVQAIVRLSGSRSERLTMGTNARQLVEQHYGWPARLSKFRELLDQAARQL